VVADAVSSCRSQHGDDAQEASLNDPTLLEWLGIDPDEINVRGESALKEATVYACVKILSEAVAKLPLKVYRESDAASRRCRITRYTRC